MGTNPGGPRGPSQRETIEKVPRTEGSGCGGPASAHTSVRSRGTVRANTGLVPVPETSAVEELLSPLRMLPFWERSPWSTLDVPPWRLAKTLTAAVKGDEGNRAAVW